MLDAPAREALPHTTRWFTTLAGHPRAVPVLGAVRLAEQAQGARPQQGCGRVAAGAAGGGGGGGGGGKPRKERSEKEKKPKHKAEKKAKPALANGAPGGADAGASRSVLLCVLLCIPPKMWRFACIIPHRPACAKLSWREVCRRASAVHTLTGCSCVATISKRPCTLSTMLLVLLLLCRRRTGCKEADRHVGIRRAGV